MKTLVYIALVFSSLGFGQDILLDPFTPFPDTSINYYNLVDAADPNNEADNVDDWEPGAAVYSFTSSSGQVHSGTRSVAFTRLSSGNTEKGFVISGLPNSTALIIDVWIYVNTTVETDPRMRTRTFDGWADNYIQVFTGTKGQWVNYTLAVTTDASTNPRTFNFELLDTDDFELQMYIDTIDIYPTP